MPSGADFVRYALQDLSVLAATRAPAAEDVQDGLVLLNQWMASLSLERLAIFHYTRAQHNLSSGVATYTIGVGGTLNTARPLALTRVSVIPDRTATPVLEIPLGQPLTLADYQCLTDKTLQSAYPLSVYYDFGWTGGLATLAVYPAPNTSVSAVVLYTPDQLQQFADSSTVYTFPPGYERLIRTHLAIELAPSYDATPSPDLLRSARQAKQLIKRANVRINELGMPAGLAGRGADYDIQVDR